MIRNALQLSSCPEPTNEAFIHIKNNFGYIGQDGINNGWPLQPQKMDRWQRDYQIAIESCIDPSIERNGRFSIVNDQFQGE